MSTIFTKIYQGEIPGHFVWIDEKCFAIADINPVQPGHVLVIPIKEYENFWEADPDTLTHLAKVTKAIGQAQIQAFNTARSTQIIAGFDVPHLHIHLIPANSAEDMHLGNAQSASNEELKANCQKLREKLALLGYEKESTAAAQRSC